MATEFVFYKLDLVVLQRLKLPDFPLPVRKEMKAQIFGSQSIDLNSLLEELRIFMDEHTDFATYYRDTFSTLAYITGVQAGKDGYHQLAAHNLELGLWHNPGDVSLRTNYALALHSLGRTDEALSQYEIVIADPNIKPALPLWMLAARIYADKGEYDRAYQLLKKCAPLFPQEESFWDFLSEMEEKAAVPREEIQMSPEMEKLLAEMVIEGKSAAHPAEVKSVAKSSLTCPKCKAEYTDGDSFCASCGQNLKAAEKICSGCGFTLAPDDVFCPSCGRKC